MPPTAEAFKEVGENMQEVQKNLTPKDAMDGKTGEEAAKAAYKKVMIEPFEKAGYDLDATLKDYATRLRTNDLTSDQAAVVGGVIALYQDQLPDMVRWGFIKEDTKDAVTSALKQ